MGRADSLTDGDPGGVTEVAVQFRRALREALQDDPEAFGLRDAALRSGERLVEALDGLRHRDPPMLRHLSASQPADDFVRRFVAEVGGDGRLVVDAVTRRAARQVAERLLAPDGPLADPTRPQRLTGELFCALYQLFFGKLVGEFIHVLIAENLKLAVPALVLLDPTDMVAGLVADQVVRILPNPCAHAAAQEPGRPPLVEAARELLTETVTQALGLDDTDLELAA
ncbi:hypothetical protein AB0K04_25495 [Micromonospora coxensis]|uniref:hypothetical protein n=1 Tax=Micromonospora coxensis TaxID=356852 RepID=UPI003449A429